MKVLLTCGCFCFCLSVVCVCVCRCGCERSSRGGQHTLGKCHATLLTSLSPRCPWFYRRQRGPHCCQVFHGILKAAFRSRRYLAVAVTDTVAASGLSVGNVLSGLGFWVLLPALGGDKAHPCTAASWASLLPGPSRAHAHILAWIKPQIEERTSHSRESPLFAQGLKRGPHS